MIIDVHGHYTTAPGALEAFQQTRNAPGALYSVAGKDAANLGWDRKAGTP